MCKYQSSFGVCFYSISFTTLFRSFIQRQLITLLRMMKMKTQLVIVYLVKIDASLHVSCLKKVILVFHYLRYSKTQNSHQLFSKLNLKSCILRVNLNLLEFWRLFICESFEKLVQNYELYMNNLSLKQKRPLN